MKKYTGKDVEVNRDLHSSISQLKMLKSIKEKQFKENDPIGYESWKKINKFDKNKI